MKGMVKPRLSAARIWNMSMGFFGIQFGFALQNGNASRILQTYGAEVEHLSLFWLAAPLTGMIVQPIIGHYSDRTWNRLGRRRPYFLVGAIATALALILLPNSSLLAYVLPPVLIGAGMLTLMDASINVAMEPFRALVADNLPDEQRSQGFSAQTFLIGAGAVLGSSLPYLLAEYAGVSKTAAPGVVPDNVIYSFYVGAMVLLATILWSIITSKEYSPEEFRQFNPEHTAEAPTGGIRTIGRDFSNMPAAMKQLGLVQFCSWFALFSMWVFTTPAVAQHIYKVQAGDTSSALFADAGNKVGFLFSIYSAVSAVYALVLPVIARKTSRKAAHAISLTAGGLSLISFYFIQDQNMLIWPMIGIGMAWGSILSTPYAILSGVIPSHKTGVYMGIFNFFVTFPQIVNGIFGGLIVKHLFHNEAIFALVMGGVFMIIAAVAVLYVKDREKKTAEVLVPTYGVA
ncbi:MFS transporter [Chitinophaga ginsengisoli]|uniref:Maltose/moltooligosaccharide transporter n=1 Tax=Chitinophaga ginsengisoli TaxID=363837 RepID=A0A2P8GLL4_9BACT|nr:MFS transporter [Chitinophaga ginsengisoli]PSL34854.1 maltose/moltooligosaccharide transporter [Chitinophaga ginsengisoli]